MPMRGKQPSGRLTQQKMLRSAVALFLEKGYNGTTTAGIARGAGMAPSAFFRAYPSKEAILLELVRRMFGGQFALAEDNNLSGNPVVLYAVETALQLHIAELTPQLRDLYVAAYSLPTTSDFIHRSTAARLGRIFGPYVPGSSGKDWYEMDLASSGVMRNFMMVPCDFYFTMDAKVTRFLDCALKIYDVPENTRKAATAAVLRLDLPAMAKSIVRATVDRVERELEGAAPAVLGAGEQTP